MNNIPEFPIPPDEKPTDLRDEVPDLIPYLQPNQRVVEVTEYPDINEPATEVDAPVSALAELLRFTGAHQAREAGTPKASLAKPDEAREELRAYEAIFGRDALIVADFLRPHYPNLFRSTITKMAMLQGVLLNPLSEEEPGKIIHEARSSYDPRAHEISTRLGWQWPYYGAVDTTLLYVKELTGAAIEDPTTLDIRYTNKLGNEQTLRHSLDMATRFIESKIHQSSLGLVEYRRLNPNGLQNQWWADSWDSMSTHDGRIANFDQPIAALAVQALAYDALLGVADICRLSATSSSDYYTTLAEHYEILAETIRGQVFEKFWQPDDAGGFFVVGLDYDKHGNHRQLDTKTSHMGLILNSRLFDDRTLKSAYLVDRTVSLLFSDELQNSSGIRTLSKNEVRYKPGGYHTGSVWPWVNNWVANGLDRQARNYSNPQYTQRARELREKTWRIVQKFKKFPEHVNGGDDPEPQLNSRRVVVTLPDNEARLNIWDRGRNTIEQPAQDYQAWTIAAYLDSLHKNSPL